MTKRKTIALTFTEEELDLLETGTRHTDRFVFDRVYPETKDEAERLRVLALLETVRALGKRLARARKRLHKGRA